MKVKQKKDSFIKNDWKLINCDRSEPNEEEKKVWKTLKKILLKVK